MVCETSFSTIMPILASLSDEAYEKPALVPCGSADSSVALAGGHAPQGSETKLNSSWAERPVVKS